MVVVVLVAPEVSLDDFSRLDTVAAAAVLTVSVPLSLIYFFWSSYASDQAISLIYFFLSSCESILARFERRFAVAECSAQVVAVRPCPWAFADEAFDIIGCEYSITDLMTPASWLNRG